MSALIDSSQAYITAQHFTKRIDTLPIEEKTALGTKIKDELAFLLKNCVGTIPIDNKTNDIQLQPLKCIFTI